MAAPVRISIAFWPSVPSLANPRPSLASCSRFRGLNDHGIGWSLGERGLDERGHTFQHLLVFRQRLRVLGREFRDFPVGQRLVGPQHERAAVRKGRERGRVPGQHLEAVPLEIEIPDDLGPEQAVDVGGRGHLEAGPQLLGDAGAAQHFAALEYQHFDPGPGEVRGGDQTVVATADNDEVVGRGHARLGKKAYHSAAPRGGARRAGRY